MTPRGSRIGHDQLPWPDSAAGASNEELAAFLWDWSNKAIRMREATAVRGYMWAIDGLREAARRLDPQKETPE